MRRLTKLGIALAGGAVVLAVLGSWLGDRWLESPGGRRLLERELSRAIGSPVHLAGDYGLRLLPRVLIAGQELSVGPEPGDAPVSVATFRAAVGLLPLLRQQLRIDSIELAGGRLDMTRLDQLAPAAAADAAPVSLPNVASLELRDFLLAYPDADAVVRLDELKVAGFQPDRPTPLALDATLLLHGEPKLSAMLLGSLILAADLSVAQVALQPVTVRIGESEPLEVRGAIGWQSSTRAVTADLRHAGQGQVIAVMVEVRFQDAPAGRLRGSLERAATGQTATVDFGFAQTDTGFRLEPIELEIDGQTLAGRGCVLDGQRTLLAASLAAATLDLDRLSDWVPGTGIDSGAGTAVAPGADLPFDLAIELEVVQATMSGATGHGVRVLIGTEPVCPDNAPEP